MQPTSSKQKRTSSPLFQTPLQKVALCLLLLVTAAIATQAYAPWQELYQTQQEEESLNRGIAASNKALQDAQNNRHGHAHTMKMEEEARKEGYLYPKETPVILREENRP